MDFEYALAIFLFSSTAAAYMILVGMGRRWRREFESKGVRYWTVPKEQRMKELMEGVWHPRLITIFYALAYFTNGYMKIAFSIWAPLFLINVRGVGTFEAALFLGLVYTSWQWKMFLGMLSDAVPMRFRGRAYRRHPWFLATGMLSAAASIGFMMLDLHEIPIWTAFFPLALTMTTAGAIFDLAADSYAVDTVPPEWHGRVLGGMSTFGQAIGGIVAAASGPLLVFYGGYRLVFVSSGITGLFAFLFLYLKEPVMEVERRFSRQAIAFTFSEKTVFIASLLMLSSAIGVSRISNPTGGMFSLIMNEIVGGFSLTTAGNLTTLVLLSGLPASLVGGWACDRWGHKRLFVISGLAMTLIGYLWMTLAKGMTAWFIALAMISNLFERLNMSTRLALMGDATPIALSGTVYQLYMSFVWIGNVPASIIIGALVSTNIPLLFAVLSSLNLIPIALSKFLIAYEAAKGGQV